MPWFRSSAGERLWYEDTGVGIPLIMLHGWCMSSAVWHFQYAALADEFRIIAPDASGHGRSEWNGEQRTFERCARDVIELCGELNLSRYLLAGWSMGGQVALQQLSLVPEQVAGLVLISATPQFTSSPDFHYGLSDSEARGMALKVQRNRERALTDFRTRLFAPGELEHSQSAADIDRLLATQPLPDTGAALEALDTLSKADLRPLLAGISVPALIMNGSADRICLPQASAYLKEHIAGAEQHVFSGCGHAPFLSRHGQFNDVLRNFSRSIW